MSQEESSQERPVRHGEFIPAEQLQQLYQIEEVAQQKSLCEKDGPHKNLGDCLWNGDPALSPPVGPLGQDVKNKISNFLKSQNPDDDKLRLDSVDQANFKRSKGPAILELEKYLAKRLEEALYGELKEEEEKAGRKIVDHTVFLDLYRSQVSKNLITSMTSYCIDADADHDYLIYEDEKKQTETRKKNLENLKKQSPPSPQQQTTQKSDSKVANAAYQDWQTCLLTIQSICYKEKKYAQLATDPNFEYSQKRACRVTNYLKGQRQILLKTAAIEEKYKELDKQKTPGDLAARYEYGSNGIKVKGIDYYERGQGPGEKGVEELTSISSNELINTSGYKKEVDELKKDYAHCFENNQIVDAEACKKYLHTNTNEQKDIIEGYTLQKNALADQLPSELTEEQAQDVLKEEGYTDSEIAELIKEQKIRDKIKQRFDEEKKAILGSLIEEVEGKTATQDGKIDALEDQDKLAKIDKELSEKTDRLKELVHFNNIVSGFLETEGDDGKTGQNTTSIFLELEDSAYAPDQANAPRAPANNQSPNAPSKIELSDDHIEQVSKAVHEAGVEKSEEGSTVSFGVDQLNEHILDYKEDDQGKTQTPPQPPPVSGIPSSPTTTPGLGPK